MYILKAIWKNIPGSAYQTNYDANLEPNFVSYLLDMAPNQKDASDALLFIGTRVIDAKHTADTNDTSIAWITELRISDGLIDEVYNYYQDVVKEKFKDVAEIIVTKELLSN